MKKTIIFTIGLLLAISLHAQKSERTVMGLLTSTIWGIEHNATSDDYTSFEKYNNHTTERIFFDYSGHYANPKRSFSIEYYLSDIIPEIFDESQVGKHKNGKYIITFAKSLVPDNLKEKGNVLHEDFVMVDEIIKLTEDEMILQGIGMTAGPRRYVATNENPWKEGWKDPWGKKVKEPKAGIPIIKSSNNK